MEIVRLLSAVRIRHSTEEQLQDGIAQVLESEGIAFEREVALTRSSRIDFMVGTVGLEVKIKGPVTAVLRQLYRYACSAETTRLVLVTTRAQHRRLPDMLCGKPVTVVYLGPL